MSEAVRRDLHILVWCIAAVLLGSSFCVGQIQRKAVPPSDLLQTATTAAVILDHAGDNRFCLFPVKALILDKILFTIPCRRSILCDESNLS